MNKIWSISWKSSAQRRKQRSYRFNAPLHIKRKFLSASLSKELKKKYGKNAVVLASGDKVKISRGKHKGHSGKIGEVNVKYSKVIVTGLEVDKKDGTKVQIPIDPSNMIITELNLNDKKRNQKISERRDNNGKKSS